MIGILKVKNLSVETKEGQKILKRINFAVQKNTLHIILGPNGSGKSTLASAILGLGNFKISEGKIFFLEREITRLSTPARVKLGLALAFQEPVYFEGISVKEYLKLSRNKLSLRELVEALQLVSLPPDKFLNREIDKTLSSGERKRIELASVILQRPKLLILDEPDAGLDLASYQEFHNLLLRIKKETQATIILITHRTSAWKFAETATLLHQGEVVFHGPINLALEKYSQILGRPICIKAQN